MQIFEIRKEGAENKKVAKGGMLASWIGRQRDAESVYETKSCEFRLYMVRYACQVER